PYGVHATNGNPLRARCGRNLHPRHLREPVHLGFRRCFGVVPGQFFRDIPELLIVCEADLPKWESRGGGFLAPAGRSVRLHPGIGERRSPTGNSRRRSVVEGRRSQKNAIANQSADAAPDPAVAPRESVSCDPAPTSRVNVPKPRLTLVTNAVAPPRI